LNRSEFYGPLHRPRTRALRVVKMHGDKTLQVMSSRGWDADATVLLYSSRPREELECLVDTSGAHGYIHKDIGFPGLVSSVNEWLAMASVF
jgi:hypothetical protein